MTASDEGCQLAATAQHPSSFFTVCRPSRSAPESEEREYTEEPKWEADDAKQEEEDLQLEAKEEIFKAEAKDEIKSEEQAGSQDLEQAEQKHEPSKMAEG